MPRADAWVGLAILVITAIAPTVLFWHPRRAYASGKETRLPSQVQFRRVDHWLRIGVVVVGGAALLSSSPALLLWHHSSAWEFAGIVVVAIGIGLLVAAKRALGFNYSPCFDGYVPFTVIDRGPYRIFRHPMYVAYLLIWAGICLVTGTAWLGIAWVVWLRWYRQAALIEEIELARRFPDYRVYVGRTNRFLPSLPQRTFIENEWAANRLFAADAADSIGRSPSEGAASSAPDAA